MQKPSVVLVATPIGNLQDLSGRAIEVLQAADIIACEDTRRTRALLTHFGISGKSLVALHAKNEFTHAPHLVEKAVQESLCIAVVSDSGMPGVSDPGQAIVQAAHNQNVLISVVPGASSVVAAIAASGFPGAAFSFLGFLPMKGSKRTRAIEQICQSQAMTAFCEAPQRVMKTLQEVRAMCGGGREVVMARELTKLHEEILRTNIDGLIERLGMQPIKGECVIVVEGNSADRGEALDDAILRALEESIRDGATQRDAILHVADLLEVKRNRVAKLAIEHFRSKK